MILTRGGRSHRKGLHSGRKAARLSCFARGSIDYGYFYATMMKAMTKTLQGQSSGSLLVRIYADLSRISWDFKREISEEEKDKIRQMSDVFESELKIIFRNIREKIGYCTKHRLVKISTLGFVEGYAPAPMEFQVRDIYRSQIPLIRWLQENIPKSEEKDIFRTMVESMERKYSIF